MYNNPQGGQPQYGGYPQVTSPTLPVHSQPGGMYPQIPSANMPHPNGGGPSYVPMSPQQDYGNQPGGMGNQLFQDLGKTVGMGGLTETAFTHFGGQFIGGASTTMKAQYNQSFATLKYYFNVNNSYVINKIKLLLFPLRHVYWKRRIHRHAEGEVFLPPRDDINAPDLYIPTMAFVTYVLMIGFVMGTSYQFTPEVLGMTASRGLVALAIEVFLIKFGFYLLNSVTVPILDVVAYCGYKYVGIVLAVLGGFIFSTPVYYVLMLVTSIFMAVFMVNTLKLLFPEMANYTEGPTHLSIKRKYFLLGVAGLQLLFGYYLSYIILR